MKKSELLATAAFALFAFSVFADARYVTYVETSGDLADPNGWSSEPPGGSDYACIDKAGPYTAGADLQWGRFYYYAYSTVIDFTATPNRKVTICDSSNLVDFQGNSRVLTLKGGEWGFDDATGKALFSGKNNEKLVLTDSCRIVCENIFAINSQNGTSYPHDNELVVSGGSIVDAKWLRLGASKCYGNKLTIHSGGKLNVGGWFYVDNNAESSGNTITVDGIGSKIALGIDEFRMGNLAGGNTFKVSNGGVIEAPKSELSVGRASSSADNIARFETGATISVNGLTLNGCRNLFSADSSTASLGSVSFGGYDNAVAATNTPVCCSSLSLSSALGHAGNSFVLNGESSVLTMSASTAAAGTDIFGEFGGGNLFALDNGASWSPAGHLRLMKNSSNNVFRVAKGAALSNPDYELTFGYANPTNCTGNCIEVLGGTLDAKKILVQGIANGIVVSNGTVRTSDLWSICLGYGYGDTPAYNSTNCYLSVKGTTPLVELPGGNFRVTKGARLRFEIPEDGYPQGHVPVICGYLSFTDGSKIEVDCAGFAEKTGGKVKLLSIANDIFAPNDDLQAIANSCIGLPPDCSLDVKANEIWLKTPSRKGLKVFVK